MKALKTVAVVLLAVLLFAGVFAGIALCSLGSLLSDPERLARETADEEYFYTLHESVERSVELTAQSLISIDKEVIVSGIDFAGIDERAVQSLEVTYRRILTGESEPLPEYESRKLYDTINASIEEYAAENGLIVEEGSAAEIYEYVRDDIDAVIWVVRDNYINKLSFVPKYLQYFDYRFVPFVISAVCAAAIAAVYRKKIFVAINVVCTAFFAGSFLPFLLSSLLVSRDYISNLALADSMLRELFIRVYRLTFGGIKAFSAPFFAVSLVLLIASIAVIAVFGRYPGEIRYGKQPEEVIPLIPEEPVEKE
ncbi:MAG: hypothetical protein J5793_02940 [Clostridia bacterium]|nr:hypothetical protein [Clostridia bacterium]